MIDRKYLASVQLLFRDQPESSQDQRPDDQSIGSECSRKKRTISLVASGPLGSV